MHKKKLIGKVQLFVNCYNEELSKCKEKSNFHASIKKIYFIDIETII
jgi:hypothetical protein